MKWLLLFVPCLLWSDEGLAAGYAHRLKNAGLDPDECYRVRDLIIARDEMRIYLTDGHLIFGKVVDGARNFAVFSAGVEGGDAEILLTPPSRSERQSLASFTQTPNLNEHLTHILLVFTDQTEKELREQIQAREPRKVPEMGALMAAQWNPVVRNFIDSFEIRLVQDHLSADKSRAGFFYAAASSEKLGNFDVLFDPRSREQIVIGQVTSREGKRFFDVWTSFAARSFRNGRRRPYFSNTIVDEIRIDATIRPDLSMNAVTRLRVTAGDVPDRSIAFDLSRRMRVSEVRVDGKPAELFVRDSLRANLLRGGENDVFLVVLQEPLRAGARHEFEFVHEGHVISKSGNGVLFVGARDSWYPSHGGNFARFQLTFRHPKELDLVATGELKEERTEGDIKIVIRETAAPARFAGFNLGDYERAVSHRVPYRVEVFANRNLEHALQPRPQPMLVVPPFPRQSRRAPEVVHLPAIPPDPTARIEDLASEVSASLEAMSGWLGPLPLKTLTVSPIPGTFGQGFPGLLYLSTLAYLHPNQRPSQLRTTQQLFFSDILQAHEVAHQWWGNVVTSAGYQDDWLMEALANYSALMFLEKRKGRKALDVVLAGYRDHLLTKNENGRTIESAGPIVWGWRLISSHSPGAWRSITYEKGSWIMHMLRGRLGDAAFLKMLSALVAENRFKRITTDQFRKHVARSLPPQSPDPKLEMFFEQWVYGAGIPALKLEYSQKGRAPRMRLRGVITQSEAPEGFTALVPVTVQLSNRKSLTKWIETSDDPVEFEIQLPAAATRVQLDPMNTMLLAGK